MFCSSIIGGQWNNSPPVLPESFTSVMVDIASKVSLNFQCSGVAERGGTWYEGVYGLHIQVMQGDL